MKVNILQTAPLKFLSLTAQIVDCKEPAGQL